MSSRFSGVVGEVHPSLAPRMEKRLQEMPKSGPYRPALKSIRGARHSLFWRGTSSRQVMESEEFAFVCDGRILGAPQLFQTISQVGLTSALREWGGEFSFALFDRRAQKLYLVRDRLGVKPLYYYQEPKAGVLTFGSQPSLLFDSPGFDFSVNNEFVGRFAGSHYRVIDNDIQSSPFRQIRQLRPGYVLTWTPDGRTEETAYWTLKEKALANSGNFDACAVDYREALKDAVGARLKAYDHSAFTLSGGLDSSSVLSCAFALTGEKQEAYSSVYADPTYDETAEIQSMLGTRVSTWHPIKIEPRDIFGAVSEMVAIHNEPVATATWLSHYFLCDTVARDGKRTLFGGLGGDELNAGEYEYFFYLFADLKRAGRAGDLDREIAQWVRHHDHPVFKKNAEVASRAWKVLTDPNVAGRCLPDRVRIDRYADAVQKDYFNVRTFEPEMDNPFESYLLNRTFQDLFRETMPCCLRAEDRHSAYYGLENVLPFLDHSLVEFMFSVPGSWKIQDGVTKILLREAMKGVLPEETRTRIKKMGWNAPAHVWFSKEFYGNVQDLISSQRFKERGIYDVSTVEKLLEEHRAIVEGGLVKDNHMMFFWQLLNMELWLRWVDDQRANNRSHA